MSTKFLSPGWRMPRNANQSKFSNYSMDFDSASSDYIDIPETSAIRPFSAKMSLSAWFKISGGSGDRTIFAVGVAGGYAVDYQLDVDTNNNLSFRVRTTSGSPYYTTITGGTTLNTNQWYHACVTWDSANINLYLDGQTDAAQVAATTFYYTGSASLPGIGSQRGATNGHINLWAGCLFQICYFDYALSLSQVTTLWGGGTSVSNPMALPSPPIAYYPLGTSAWNGQYLAENNAIGDYVFDFDASSSNYIDCGNDNSLNLTSQITLSAWVKTTDQDSINNIVKKDDGASNRSWNLSWRGSSGGGGSRLVFWNWSSDGSYNYLYTSGTPASNFADGNWHHVVATYDGTTDANGAKIYLDGDLMSQGAIDRVGTGLDTTTANVTIGNDLTASISNVQIFNTALSGTDIETLYNYGSPIRTLANIPQSSNLKAWYKLDASEVYNSSTTEWTINDALSSYPQSLEFKRINSGANRSTVRISNSTFQYPSGKISVSAWFVWNGSNSGQCIVSDYYPYGTGDKKWYLNKTVGTGSNAKIEFRIYDTNGNTSFVRSTTSLVSNTWYHVAAVYDGTTNSDAVKIYLNGIYEDQETSTSGGLQVEGSYLFRYMPLIGNYSYIGGESAPYGSGGTGFISNVCIWNDELTDGSIALGETALGEIKELYNGGKPATSVVKSESLIGWWKLDASSSSKQLWPNNNLQFLNEKYQPNYTKSLDFGLASDFFKDVEIPTAAMDVSSQITASAWVNTSKNSGGTGRQAIISSWEWSGNNKSFNLQIDNSWSSGYTKPSAWINTSSGQMIFGNDNASNVTNITQIRGYVTDSSWHHILFTWDGSTTAGSLKMFVDGYLYMVGTPAFAGPIVQPTTQRLKIGKTASLADGTGSTNVFGPRYENQGHGLISNVQIWDTALTYGSASTVDDIAGGQVAQVFNNGTPLTTAIAPSNMKCWYKLDNLSNTQLDSSGNGNDGTLNTGTTWSLKESFITQKAANTQNTENQTGGTNISEHSLVNNNVSTINGDSSGMSQANLVQSDLQTVAPYSKYALDFDSASATHVNVGNDSSLNLTSQMSVSIWAKPTGTAEDVYGIISNFPQTYKFTFEYYRANTATARTLRLRVNPSNGVLPGYLLTYVDLSDGNWHHLAFTVDGTTNANGINVYVDGAKLGSFTAANPGINSNTSPTIIGNYQTNSTWDFDGYLSNASIWDTALTESQITEIYNEGLPGNLNNHSAYSNLVSWWQLGENSSFDGNDWICADEKGSNNGTSTGMPVSALVNGVGTTANGVSSGMAEGNLVGDAPYSTANAISSGMSVESRVTGSGNTP